MMRFKKSIVFALVSIGVVLTLSAEKKEKKRKNEETQTKTYTIKKPIEVTVTATMSPQEVKDSSSSLCVVGTADIEMSSSQNALDILKDFSGIFVNRTGDYGRADVDIRGLGSNCRQIAVLVDGKPEKMGLFGCAVSHAFPLDNVERIEMMKGPASVLYGVKPLGEYQYHHRKTKKRNETHLSYDDGEFYTNTF